MAHGKVKLMRSLIIGGLFVLFPTKVTGMRTTLRHPSKVFISQIFKESSSVYLEIFSSFLLSMSAKFGGL